jgi:flavorubredoxin
MAIGRWGRAVDCESLQVEVFIVNVLVAYATKNGSTAQVAQAIAHRVRADGAVVELSQAVRCGPRWTATTW